MSDLLFAFDDAGASAVCWPGGYGRDRGRDLQPLTFESDGGGGCEHILPLHFDVRSPRQSWGLEEGAAFSVCGKTFPRGGSEGGRWADS